jgi:hypothetical protein
VDIHFIVERGKKIYLQYLKIMPKIISKYLQYLKIMPKIISKYLQYLKIIYPIY